jgi:L-lysine exporter family protein LysE/ArgO
MVSFIQGFLLSLSLCADIGIVNLAIIRAGIARGFWPAFAIGFGSCFGDLIYLVLVLLGFAFVLQFAFVQTSLWIGGTVTLLWLAWKMAREAWRPRSNAVSDETHMSSSMSENLKVKDVYLGVGLAVLSPSAVLWYAVVAVPIVAGLQVSTSSVFGASTMLFIAGFFSAGFIWSSCLAWMSSRSGKRAGTLFLRWMSIISAILFLCFAIHVFHSGL